jgi:hypothetical protein
MRIRYPGSGIFSKIPKLGPENPDQKHRSFIVDSELQYTSILTDMESYLSEYLHYQSS